MSGRQKSFHCHITPRSPFLAEVLQASKASKCISFFIVTALEAYLGTEEGKVFAQHYLKNGTGDHQEGRTSMAAEVTERPDKPRRFNLDTLI